MRLSWTSQGGKVHPGSAPRSQWQRVVWVTPF